jgi:hypothetical protein
LTSEYAVERLTPSSAAISVTERNGPCAVVVVMVRI